MCSGSAGDLGEHGGGDHTADLPAARAGIALPTCWSVGAALRAPPAAPVLTGEAPAQRAHLRARVLGGQLVLAQRGEQQRHGQQRDEEA